MRVAVVGYGKMGREVEAVLRDRGHEIVVATRGHAFPVRCQVGIDFTSPEAVLSNVAAAMAARARYVVGTTGWHDRYQEVRFVVETGAGGLVHAANFSIGVNLYYRLVQAAAQVIKRYGNVRAVSQRE